MISNSVFPRISANAARAASLVSRFSAGWPAVSLVGFIAVFLGHDNNRRFPVRRHRRVADVRHYAAAREDIKRKGSWLASVVRAVSAAASCIADAVLTAAVVVRQIAIQRGTGLVTRW
jgi:hypothetical protein